MTDSFTCRDCGHQITNFALIEPPRAGAVWSVSLSRRPPTHPRSAPSLCAEHKTEVRSDRDDGASGDLCKLTIADLVPRRIVVIEPASQSFCLTIAAVDAEFVLFYAVAHTTVCNFVVDGELVDDKLRVVRVFEYLGEP